MPRITSLTVRDIRFPTSRQLDGSDAMNPDPDYSAAYVILHTDAAGSAPLAGHGLAFTIGRGNDIVCAAIRAHSHLLIGRTVEECAEAEWGRSDQSAVKRMRPMITENILGFAALARLPGAN